jgi:hypothetical protein
MLAACLRHGKSADVGCQKSIMALISRHRFMTMTMRRRLLALVGVVWSFVYLALHRALS